jgi:uncharacterized protein YbjT (DUF2867 family)
MKITVFGASGLIGSRVVKLLRADGHDVVAASHASGVDVLTGAGLADALTGATTLVDVTNSPDLGGAPAMEFFTRSTPNLVEAARRAGVVHYVALSIVGADELPDSGYMRAKVAQEGIIIGSGIPYSIVRATQFAEFADDIIASMTNGDEIRVPDALIQPIPAEEVAAAVARTAAAPPVNGIVNTGGPHRITFEQLARETQARRGDRSRTIIVDPAAPYFGATLQMRSLVTPE